MGEYYSAEVKGEQAKVSQLEASAESKKDSGKLKETLNKNHKVFFDSVDRANTEMDRAQESIKEQNNLSEVFGAKEDLKKYLRTVATIGQKALQKEGEEKQEITSEIVAIDKQSESITNVVQELENSVPLFIALDTASQMHQTEGKSALDNVEAIKKDTTISPKEKKEKIISAARSAIEQVSKAKIIATSVSGYPASLQYLIDEELEPMNESLKEMSQILVYYEYQVFCEKDEYKKYIKFNPKTGDIAFTEEYKFLPPEKQQKLQIDLIDIRVKIESQIEEDSCMKEHEKSFFRGEESLQNSDYIEAKSKFLNFYNTERGLSSHTLENAQRLEKTREMLKQITKMQLAQAQQRLNLLEVSIKSHFGELKLGTNHNVALLNVQHMRQVLEQAYSILESSNALTIEEVYQNIKEMKDIFEGSAVARFQEGFGGANPIFDVLKAQQEIDAIKDPEKRKQKLLQMGREARELGMFEVAKNYYEAAFQQEISEKAKVVKKEDFEAQMRRDATFQAEFSSKMKEWGEAVREKFKNDWKAKNINAEPTPEAMREFDKTLAQEAGSQSEKVFSIMLNEAYGKLLKTLVHKDFTDNSSLPNAHEWNQAYGNTFINLENIDAKWYQFWKFTDAEWNAKKYQYVMDLSLIIIAAATAGTTSSLAVGARAGLVEALGEAALSEAGQIAIKRGGIHLARFAVKQLGAQEAAKHGIRTIGEFALESALFSATEGALNGVVKGDWTTYSSPEAFMKAWGRSVVMLGGCKIGAMGYTFAGGGAAKTLVGKGADLLASTAVEVGTMQAIGIGMMLASGEPITQEKFAQIMHENILMSVGLKGAHYLTAPISRKSETAQTDADPSKIMRDISRKADKAEAKELRSKETTPKAAIEKPISILESIPNSQKHDLDNPKIFLALPKDNNYPFIGPKSRLTEISDMLKNIFAEKGIKEIEAGKKIFAEVSPDDPRLTPEMQNMGKAGKIGLLIMPNEIAGIKKPVLDVFFVVEIDGKFHRINKANEWNQKPLNEVQAEVNEIYIPSKVRDIGDQRYVLTPIIDNIEHPSSITRAEYEDFMNRLKKSKISIGTDIGEDQPGGKDSNMVRYKGKLYLCDGGDVIGAPMGEKIPDAKVSTIASYLEPRITP